MNVLIPHSWIKDFVKTNADVKEIARVLSAHSFSVEKIIDEDVFEIEVTPNRGDALSVAGIARELMAVLPANGYSVEWVKKEFPPAVFSGKDSLKVKITDSTLVPRFSAVVIDNIKVKESPDYIKNRLNKVGIRPINNVVDVTNYYMIELGQPMHAFDYDKISKHEMIVRESKKGEVITTLDGVKRTLPEGVIVIEDGDGRLIDLCGIMGAENSEVDENTEKVLLFVQVYDPVKIRKASMSLGHRTEAALRFEKGVDFEGVVPSLVTAARMLAELGGGEVSSELIDIKGVEYKEKKIKVDYEKIDRIAGIDIGKDFVDATLESLGFEIKGGEALVPSWRYDDIEISEDLAEEVVRIYGYEKLEGVLPGGALPYSAGRDTFVLEDKAKDFLKHMGFFECYNYSAVSKELAGENGDAIKIKNPLNEDFEYLRTSLTPKLLEVLNKNRGYSDKIKVFELAPVFLPSKEDLPEQPLHLGIAAKGHNYLEFKGFVEALLDELKIKKEISHKIREHVSGIFSCEMCFDCLMSSAVTPLTYSTLTGFNSIKEDITIIVKGGFSYGDVVEEIKGADARVNKVLFKDIYGDALTLSIDFLDRHKQITSEETKNIREDILKGLERKFGIKLKV
mgnify:CR=1 FL=1